MQKVGVEALSICVPVHVSECVQKEVNEDLRRVRLVPEAEASCGADAADSIQWPAYFACVVVLLQ